jgi:polar amino acid transport system substrate-binding protein
MRTTMTVGARRALVAIAGSLLAVAVVGAGAVTAGANASPVKLPAKYASGLRMAVDATYPPDEFVQNGHIVGFDADLGMALGKVLGVKVTLVDATFDTIIPGIQDGKFDVGNSSFTDTKAREKVVDFIDYFKAGEGFYEEANSKKTFNGLKSLCGHSVAVETGTTEQSDAESQAKLCKVNVLSYADQNQVNLAVSDGRADLGFADSQVAAYIVHLSDGQFKLTGTPFETAPYGFAVAKGSGLAAPLLAAVKTIMADGQYKQILDKWGVQQGAISNPTINGATS